MKRTAVEKSKYPVEYYDFIIKNKKANETTSLTYHFGFKLKSKEHPYESPTTRDSEMILKYANSEMFFNEKGEIFGGVLGNIRKRDRCLCGK